MLAIRPSAANPKSRNPRLLIPNRAIVNISAERHQNKCLYKISILSPGGETKTHEGYGKEGITSCEITILERVIEIISKTSYDITFVVNNQEFMSMVDSKNEKNMITKDSVYYSWLEYLWRMSKIKSVVFAKSDPLKIGQVLNRPTDDVSRSYRNMMNR